jgi:para-aminobenzoate synthetase component 1
VEVEELFGIYTFAQVHQMISTIKGVLAPNEDGLEALLAAFPMGSMTGAPKRRSIELIEKYEKSQRGWYSGSLGYINPQGDFDFNVIIRSLLYEAERHCLSFQVGGAIVYDSVPEAEYEECLLKAKALRRVLGLS